MTYVAVDDTLMQEEIPGRARSALKVLVLPFLIGFGGAMVWMSAGDEQPLEDFEGAISMNVRPLQKGATSMPMQLARTGVPKPRELIIASSGGGKRVSKG